MIHLFIQVPCLNEEKQIGPLLESLPKSLNGVDKISILVINDGSTDSTSEVAKQHGAHYVIDFPANRGLSAAFQAGISFCLRNGADIIVNTDADNQYPSDYIEALIRPILEKSADFTIGNRQTADNGEFSFIKRFLQKWGTRLSANLSNLEIKDAASGFRAYSRESALSISVTNPYTYTLETLIQLGSLKMNLINVPIKTNSSTRPSRLFKSNFSYVKNNGLVLIKTYIQYMPLSFFMKISIFMAVSGLGLLSPTIYEFGFGNGRGHLQSLISGAICLIGSIQMLGIGLLADATRSLRAATKRDINNLNIKIFALADDIKETKSYE